MEQCEIKFKRRIFKNKKNVIQKNKITFISRQTRGKSIDFDLIIEEIKTQKNQLKPAQNITKTRCTAKSGKKLTMKKQCALSKSIRTILWLL